MCTKMTSQQVRSLFANCKMRANIPTLELSVNDEDCNDLNEVKFFYYLVYYC